MTAIPLPNLPNPWVATPRLRDFGVVAEPPLGGVAQRVARLGSRWEVEFTSMPAMEPAFAIPLIAARAKSLATNTPVSVAWPQPANAGQVRSPLVNGASQTGTSLITDAWGASYQIRQGWFSVAVSGQNYLYMITDLVNATSAGAATLSIAPMLRASPADNAALAVLAPVIEGWITGAEWTLEMLSNYGLPAFTIQEAA